VNLYAGILIIGSLFWDDEGGRDRWRRWRLYANHKRVRVPIRYGRRAASRKNTYTMVFSRMASEDFGFAIVVGCRRPIESTGDLMHEARWLWSAETKTVPSSEDAEPGPDVSASWGRVTALVRPDAPVPEGLVQRLVSTAGTRDEALLVDDRGTLDVAWPRLCDDDTLMPFDLLLATTNRPTDKYPTAQAIAEAWNANGYRDYFDNNQRAGITTFQDEDIRRYLK
jgi:hypothetical protein